MSRAIVDAPTTDPSASRRGDTASDTSRRAAVFRLPDRLEVPNQLSVLDFREDSVDLVGIAWRDEQTHAAPDDFVGRVAVHQLRATIPSLDAAVQIFRENSIVRGFDERGQLARRFVR